jgi:RHS repeat-associated protein
VTLRPGTGCDGQCDGGVHARRRHKEQRSPDRERGACLWHVIVAQDYYSFGMQVPGRSFNNGSHRYGFNGKENDNEVKGVGNETDYGIRVYDPRVRRFMSVDPIQAKCPELTPYQYASNSPITFIDLDGLEMVYRMPNGDLYDQPRTDHERLPVPSGGVLLQC